MTVFWWVGLIGSSGAAVALLVAGLRASDATARARIYVQARSLAQATVGLACLLSLVALVELFGAVGGESVDPSQSARIPAQGAAGAVKLGAFALCLPPIPLFAWLALRRKAHASA
jgi:hypothetical protein